MPPTFLLPRRPTGQTPDATVRWAGPHDVPRLLAMMRTLAAHEGSQAALRTSLDALLRDGFGPVPRFRALLAERASGVAGYVTCTTGYSIWAGRTTLLVDDVFVAPEGRGTGIGRTLMEAIGRTCIEEGHAFVRWTVEPDNARAIGFYERLGARLDPKGLCTWVP